MLVSNTNIKYPSQVKLSPKSVLFFIHNCQEKILSESVSYEITGFIKYCLSHNKLRINNPFTSN